MLMSFKKKCRSDVDFSPIEIGSNKVRRSNAILLIEITSNKVCQNDADLSPVEITSNKARQNKNVRELSNILGQNDVAYRNYIETVRGTDVDIYRFFLLDISTPYRH